MALPSAVETLIKVNTIIGLPEIVCEYLYHLHTLYEEGEETNNVRKRIIGETGTKRNCKGAWWGGWV